jgi:hypothetical protein
VKLQEANLQGANLQEANLQEANLQEANLVWTNLVWTNLQEADLQRGHLQEADLQRAGLQGADLREANLQRANLREASLQGVKLQGTNLREASLREANLSKASLQGASLQGASLQGASLQEASLQGASLQGASLQGASLQGANFQEALLQETALVDLDVSVAQGLDTVIHMGPSYISTDTLIKSRNKIPEVFLLGCGVPESFIDYLPSLIGAMEPLQFYSCFISYSTKDEEFAKRLHSKMRDNNLRVWFANEDLKGGHKLHEQIDEAIRVYDKLILVLSPQSIHSKWVMNEVRRTRKAELASGRRKFFPIALMDYKRLNDWQCIDSETGTDLAAEIREYYVPDFRGWKDHDTFEGAFAKLLEGLKAVDEPPAPRLPADPTHVTSKLSRSYVIYDSTVHIVEGGSMTVFDQSNQHVNYQYNSNGDINFGAVQNRIDLVGELEKLKAELVKAGEGNRLNRE